VVYSTLGVVIKLMFIAFHVLVSVVLLWWSVWITLCPVYIWVLAMFYGGYYNFKIKKQILSK